MDWNQSPKTHVSLNVILSLIGPPRGCPLKAIRFSLKKFQGCSLKAVPPAHQSHRSRSCDLLQGSPSANYCIWKEPEHGRKRNKAPRLLQRKMSFLTVSLHSSKEGTRTNKPSDDSHTAHTSPFTQTPGCKCLLWPSEDGGSGCSKLIAHRLSVQCRKTSMV